MALHLERFLFDVRQLAGDDDHTDGDAHSAFGVHIEYKDLYNSILFLSAIYISGQIAARLLRMPNLVGEIVAGIVLGPPLLNFVPLTEAWVMLGEIGLILLVIEAGIDIDLSTLKLIGARGFIIAFLGSIFPIGLGIVLALVLGLEPTAAIAAGASFGPTSLGIALNILRSGNILNTPVGQLIVSAAVIDDMIALVVLSQLRALTGNVTVQGVLIPVISALLFLILGGYLAIFLLPGLIQRYLLAKFSLEHHGKIELAVMLAMVLGLMPATFYSKASYLMGAFVAGLTFCTSHSLHNQFVSQFKRVLQWLMRIFFAASIGFQVPVKEFGSFTVIWKGLFFCIALLGKLGAGFMVPNFTQTKRFTGIHLRDCLITGFSLAAEGEFAFVIAVFGVDSGLIDTETYSSIVLAVLLSTIIPPFLLRYVITKYNKLAEAAVRLAAEEEMTRRHDLNTSMAEIMTGPQREEMLKEGIKNQTAVFFCIQTQSGAKWGLMFTVTGRLNKLGLEVIDHRSWHPRGVNTTLVNEIYVRDAVTLVEGKTAQELVDEKSAKIKEQLLNDIDQPETAKVKVTRWYPGVVTEIIDETVTHKETVGTKSTATIEERLLTEATSALEQHRSMQTSATHHKSVTELMAEMQHASAEELVEELKIPDPNKPATGDTTIPLGGDMVEPGSVTNLPPAVPAQKVRNRRVRQKMRSTPVFGGSLFGEDTSKHQMTSGEGQSAPTKQEQAADGGQSSDVWERTFRQTGHGAELTINGESYQIRLSEETLKNLRKGYQGDTLDRRGFSMNSSLSIQQADAPVVNMLQGYVRNTALTNITEEMEENNSETLSGDGKKA